MILTRGDGPHWAGHDVLAALPVDVEFLILDVQLYVRQSGIQVVSARKVWS